MSKIYVGQTKLSLGIKLDQSIEGTAEALMGFITPSGKKGFWPGIIESAAAGLVRYDIQSASDINMPGSWKLFLKLTDQAGKVSISTAVNLTVYTEGQ